MALQALLAQVASLVQAAPTAQPEVQALQVPEPLQVLPPPQLVPAGYTLHAPAPLQVPVVPHVVADWVMHEDDDMPAATAPHTPFCPPPLRAALQAMHATPLHAVLQQ